MRQRKFFDGFEKIKISLKKIYRLLTSGGDADLEFIDTLDPFEDGIRLTARPPRKHWMAISKLSGGEQVINQPQKKLFCVVFVWLKDKI